jgi:hypothetical protein
MSHIMEYIQCLRVPEYKYSEDGVRSYFCCYSMYCNVLFIVVVEAHLTRILGTNLKFNPLSF